MSSPRAASSPSEPSATVPLTSVSAGVVVRLREVRDPASKSVLRSLGLGDDSVLRLCKGGDPCIVQVQSTRIGLSSAVARCLYVEPTADSR